MGQMITKGNELLRISPNNKQCIEYSSNDGRSWYSRLSSSSCGEFQDIKDNGK